MVKFNPLSVFLTATYYLVLVIVFRQQNNCFGALDGVVLAGFTLGHTQKIANLQVPNVTH